MEVETISEAKNKMRIKFYEKLEITRKIAAKNAVSLSHARYEELVNNLIDAKDAAGKEARHYIQSQGSVERANQDIENMLTTWIQEQNNLE